MDDRIERSAAVDEIVSQWTRQHTKQIGLHRPIRHPFTSPAHDEVRNGG